MLIINWPSHYQWSLCINWIIFDWNWITPGQWCISYHINKYVLIKIIHCCGASINNQYFVSQNWRIVAALWHLKWPQLLSIQWFLYFTGTCIARFQNMMLARKSYLYNTGSSNSPSHKKKLIIFKNLKMSISSPCFHTAQMVTHGPHQSMKTAV